MDVEVFDVDLAATFAQFSGKEFGKTGGPVPTSRTSDSDAARAEVRLRAKIVQLKETIANKNEELGRLREDVPALVRALNQLTAENAALRHQLRLPVPNVVPLRPHEPPGTSGQGVTPDQ